MNARTLPKTLSIIAALTTGAMASVASARPIDGIPRVVDGDTIALGDTRIRLLGIDAPETDQVCLDRDGARYPCGLRARDALAVIIGNRSVTCAGGETDQYGRRLMTCSVAGDDINAQMVASGWALAYVRYSKSYVGEEQGAKEHSEGLWAGAFIAPWDWRHRDRSTVILGAISVPVGAQAALLPASADAPPVPGCQIKGNINRRGERIYHLPGMKYYEQTRIEERNGERWFCTEEEARAAGWRKARE
jgi:endonuclease YncB( thermonuclease family)